VRDGITNQDLLDINGNYEKGKPFAGSLGGQLLQFCLTFQVLTEFANPHEPVAEGVVEAHPKKCPADILTSPTFIAFLLTYLKELKNESGLVIQISQHTL